MARWYTSVNEAIILDILFRKNIENLVPTEAFFSEKHSQMAYFR